MPKPPLLLLPGPGPQTSVATADRSGQCRGVPPTSTPFWKRLPFARLGALVVLLLVAGEQFPLTRLPMYSSFGPTADYFYIADAAGQPLACLIVFGSSTADLKKMYRARLDALVGPRSADDTAVTPDERRRAGEDLIAYLRVTGAQRGTPVPAGPVRLMRVEVQRAPTGGFSQHEEQLAEK